MGYASAVGCGTVTAGQAPRPLPTRYAALPEPGGRVRVKDVPIFAEHVRRFDGGTTLRFGLSWLKSAAINTRLRMQRDGYLPPVHLGHHDFTTTDERERVGVFDAPHVARVLFQGRPTWVLFADLVLDSAADLAKLAKYPYRSAEILDFTRPPEVDSVALLSSRVPFFKLPNLQVDDGALRGVRVAFAAAPVGKGASFCWPEPLVLRAAAEDNGMRLDSKTLRQLVAAALVSEDQAVRALVYEEGITPPPKKDGEEIKALAAAAQPGAAPATEPLASDGAGGQATGAPSLEQHEQQELGAIEAIGQKVDACLACCQQVLAVCQQLAEVFQAPLGGEGGEEAPVPGAGAGEQAESKPVMRAQAPAAAPVAAQAPAAAPAPAGTPGVAALAYGLKVQATALKAQAAQAAGAQERDKAVAWAEAQLADRNVGEPEEFRKEILEHYGLSGVAGVQLYVAGLKKVLPALPGPAAHQPMPAAHQALEPADAPALAQYAHDPALLARARMIQAQWAARPKVFSDAKLEAWLEGDDALHGQARKV